MNEQEIRNIAFEQIENILSEEKEKLNYQIKWILNNQVSQLFENTLFMERAESKVIKMVAEEVRVAVANAELHKIVGNIVRDYVSNNLKEVVSEVVEKHVEFFNKKLSKEHELAKQLSYSIHSEIKHALMHAPISYNAEKQIMDKIMSNLNDLKVQKKQIENTPNNTQATPLELSFNKGYEVNQK